MTASLPSFASATICHSDCSAINAQSPRRTTSWSSAINRLTAHMGWSPFLCGLSWGLNCQVAQPIGLNTRGVVSVGALNWVPASGDVLQPHALQPDRRVTDRRATLLRPWPKPPPTISEAVLVTVSRWLEPADASFAHKEIAKPPPRRLRRNFKKEL